LLRQASDNQFNPTNELFSYEEAKEKTKNLTRNIVATFTHAYNKEGTQNNDKKEEEE
jgi:hypothetical protein